MTLRKYPIGLAALLLPFLIPTAWAQTPTWIYDPDGGKLPNDVGEPFDAPGFQVGGNVFRSLITIGPGDNVLNIDTTIDDGDGTNNNSLYFEIPGQTPNWTVSSATGYSVSWRVKVGAATTGGGADLLAGNPANCPILRLFRGGNGELIARLQNATGNEPNAPVTLLHNPDGFHTFRMDVQGSTASLFVDDYPWPVATLENLDPTPVDVLRFGDATGPNNGQHQTDRITTWQSGPVGIQNPPDPQDPANTLFLAHYDGNTGSMGLDADFAVGSPKVNCVSATGACCLPDDTCIETTQADCADQSGTWQGGGSLCADVTCPSPEGDCAAFGGVIDTTDPKFGAGAMDGTGVGTQTYETAGNYNLEAGTVEMWIKTENWNNGGFYGFFSIWAGSSNIGDIRLQKRNNNVLQAYFAANSLHPPAILTSEPLNLDNQWHHIAWTWDMKVGVSAIYLDGQVLTTTLTEGPLQFKGTLAPRFEVGTMQGGGSAFDGLIDEFRISTVDLYGGRPFTPPNAPHTTPTEPPTGACCNPEDGTCIDTTFPGCVAAAGVWQGIQTTCSETHCPVDGACCLVDGTCTEVKADECAELDGTFQGEGSTCELANCTAEPGACCLPDGTCLETSQENCQAQGGVFRGFGTDCASTDCTVVGACCVPGSTCSQATQAQCLSQGGSYVGDGIACELTNCTPIRDTPSMLFLAHYDGNTGNNGLDADVAAGSPVVIGMGGVIDGSNPKFGAAALDGTPSGAVTYETAGNFNLEEGTIEMWVYTDNWRDGAFRGLFSIWSGSSNTGDIRLQKTSADQLQAYMAANDFFPGWSLTSPSLNLAPGYHHIAWTWSFAANASAIYVDGVVVSNTPSTTVQFSPLGTVAPEFQIGTLQSGGNDWPGPIDEVRISGTDLYKGLNFPPPTAPFQAPGLFADTDGDLDVDMDDFAVFQRCFTGSGGTAVVGCHVFDRPEPGFPTGDGDVDLTDLSAFAACASGANVPADPACANQGQ